MASENSTQDRSARWWLGLGFLPANVFSIMIIFRGVTLLIYSDATPDGISDFGPFFDLLQGLILLPGGIITMVALGLSRYPLKSSSLGGSYRCRSSGYFMVDWWYSFYCS